MSRTNLATAWPAICLAGLLCAATAQDAAAQAQKPALPIAPAPARFSSAPLVKLGDRMMYGTHTIIKIGDGVYDIHDADTVPRDSTVPQGSDMYLLVGPRSALLIDLSNNYVTGVERANLKPRPNSAAEFRNMIFGLAGGRPVDVALSHDHPDHIGMTGAFVGEPRATLLVSELETLAGLKAQTGIEPSAYKRFKAGEKVFDLGGGRVVNTLYTRGHTPGSTSYIYKNQGLVFTGDAWGVGWGLSITSVDNLKLFASDSQTFNDYIKANFTPYERYALKVFPAHSRYVGTRAPRSETIPYFDAGYFDWRWLQEMSSAANGVLKGQWTQKGTGLVPVAAEGAAPAPPASEADRRYTFVYGTGAVSMPLRMAYEAAGLPVPADGKPPQ